MIRSKGKGDGGNIGKRVGDHAPGVAPLYAALMEALLASKLARDEEKVHVLELGSGGQGTNLHVADGKGYAFRGRATGGDGYDLVQILSPIKQGKTVAVVRHPKDAVGAIAKLV